MPVLLSNIDRLRPQHSRSAASPDRKKGFVLSTSMPALKTGEVHLWTMTPSLTGITEFAALLSPSEMERARRFRFAGLSERFVSDHGRLRLLLAAYLEADPQGLQFLENEQGKPRLANGPDCRLRFNMSHTRGLTMIAVCLDAELGVDVEVQRAIEDRDAIAAMYFSAAETQALAAQPAHERDAAFLRCWTRKEAYLKARGEGLSLPLDKFEVSLAASDRAAFLHCEWDRHETQRWMLEHLQPMAGYVGALAIEHGPWSLLHFTWPPDNQFVEQAGDRS